MASLKPKLFCGVALRMKGRLTLQARTCWSNWPLAGRDTCNLRHNTCQTTVSKPVGQRLHTDRTNQTLHLLQTVSPKRETIRGTALTVKPSAGAQG